MEKNNTFVLHNWSGGLLCSIGLYLAQKQSQIDDEEAVSKLNRRIEEDRDSLIYSKLTEEGRWYFSFSPLQIFIAVFGLVGCVLFLISSPFYFEHKGSFLFLGLSFFVLVLFPWLVLFVLNFQGVKKVLLGLEGISVYHGFSKKIVKWNDITSAVIEYHPNLNLNYLHLLLLSKDNQTLLDFNISQKKSDVFARRHFVKNIVKYVGNVNYKVHGEALETAQTETEQPALESEVLETEIDGR